MNQKKSLSSKNIEIKEMKDFSLALCRDKDKAFIFLVKAGIYTKKGNLKRKYK